MSTTIIQNIKQLIGVQENTEAPIQGKALANLPVLENAWLEMSEGKIKNYGTMATLSSEQLKDRKSVV